MPSLKFNKMSVVMVFVTVSSSQGGGGGQFRWAPFSHDTGMMFRNECKVSYVIFISMVWEIYRQQHKPLSTTTSVGLAHASPITTRRSLLLSAD